MTPINLGDELGSKGLGLKPAAGIHEGVLLAFDVAVLQGSSSQSHQERINVVFRDSFLAPRSFGEKVSKANRSS